MKVSVEIDLIEVDGDHSVVDGLRVTCERCGHDVKVMGRTSASARYAAFKLKEECPNDESNYYDVDWYE